MMDGSSERGNLSSCRSKKRTREGHLYICYIWCVHMCIHNAFWIEYIYIFHTHTYINISILIYTQTYIYIYTHIIGTHTANYTVSHSVSIYMTTFVQKKQCILVSDLSTGGAFGRQMYSAALSRTTRYCLGMLLLGGIVKCLTYLRKHHLPGTLKNQFLMDGNGETIIFDGNDLESSNWNNRL